MKKQNAPKRPSSQEPVGITRITVSGYKSIAQEKSIEIRPLTILAGANSSGKSSIMQPLLLLKQTLEASYDPGALRLDGPNVKFTSADQLLSGVGKGKRAENFLVGIELYTVNTRETSPKKATFKISFGKSPQRGFDVRRMTYADKRVEVPLRPGMSEEEILLLLPGLKYDLEWMDQISETFSTALEIPKGLSKSGHPELVVNHERCFLRLDPEFHTERHFPPASSILAPHIRQVIHLPGLRGTPERTYPVTAAGPTFSGTFENYTATLIAQWQVSNHTEKLNELSGDLEKLGLTWKVTAKPINDTQVEIQVGRLTSALRHGARDLVNVADVGFGVSQTLPVLVALHAARPGQLVYLEQPEIHLHPRAQSAMAQVLADAAKRGVRVVAETHSDLLLLGIQTMVAKGELSPELVKLHWFSRREDGVTEVTSTDLDETGSFGNWPEDFGEVALEAKSRYLDATDLLQTRH